MDKKTDEEDSKPILLSRLELIITALVAGLEIQIGGTKYAIFNKRLHFLTIRSLPIEEREGIEIEWVEEHIERGGTRFSELVSFADVIITDEEVQTIIMQLEALENAPQGEVEYSRADAGFRLIGGAYARPRPDTDPPTSEDGEG